jgi:hypothetical protein
MQSGIRTRPSTAVPRWLQRHRRPWPREPPHRSRERRPPPSPRMDHRRRRYPRPRRSVRYPFPQRRPRSLRVHQFHSGSSISNASVVADVLHTKVKVSRTVTNAPVRRSSPRGCLCRWRCKLAFACHDLGVYLAELDAIGDDDMFGTSPSQSAPRKSPDSQSPSGRSFTLLLREGGPGRSSRYLRRRRQLCG